MRDSATIEIDYTRGHVSLNCDQLDSTTVDRAAETTHSYLIAGILALQIRSLMRMSKQELWALYVDSIKVMP